MPDPFQFDLVSPERLLMSEQVSEVVVPGTDGEFTVFINHAPVMSTLRPGILRIKRDGSEDQIFVRGGFADVNPSGLTILAEEATPMAELKADALAEHIKTAEEAVAAAKDETAKADEALKLDSLKQVQTQIAG